jgi:hypothetical protein
MVYGVIESAMIKRASDIMDDVVKFYNCKICKCAPLEVEGGDYTSCSNRYCDISSHIYPDEVWQILMRVDPVPSNSPYTSEREIELAVKPYIIAGTQVSKIEGNAPMMINAGPQYAWLIISPTMRSALRKDGDSYIRDAGGWSVEFKNVNSLLISISTVMLRNGKELVPCSSEEYVRDNGKFAKGICK